MLFGGGSAAEGAEVTSSSGARINFPGAQPHSTGLELDHALFPAVACLADTPKVRRRASLLIKSAVSGSSRMRSITAGDAPKVIVRSLCLRGGVVHALERGFELLHVGVLDISNRPGLSYTRRETLQGQCPHSRGCQLTAAACALPCERCHSIGWPGCDAAGRVGPVEVVPFGPYRAVALEHLPRVRGRARIARSIPGMCGRACESHCAAQTLDRAGPQLPCAALSSTARPSIA